MMRDLVVFVGPSISSNQVREFLPKAHILPPVACGDILKVLISIKPKVIAIIDGFFEQVGSVWHKEILFAMQQGVAVYGASSMGALRAAELHQFGMCGVGKVFRAYRDAELEDDDEVAVLHRPARSNYEPISVAMVNVRATVAKALEQNVLNQDGAQQILMVAKSLFYKDRIFDKIIELVLRQYPENQSVLNIFNEWLRQGNYVDQKKLDAFELLAMLQDKLVPVSSSIPIAQHTTVLLRKLLEKCACEPSEVELQQAAEYPAGFIKYTRLLAYVLRSLQVLSNVLEENLNSLQQRMLQIDLEKSEVFKVLLMLFEPQYHWQDNLADLSKLSTRHIDILKLTSLFVMRLQWLLNQEEIFFDSAQYRYFLEEMQRAIKLPKKEFAELLDMPELPMFMLIKNFLNNGADSFLPGANQEALVSYYEQAKLF